MNQETGNKAAMREALVRVRDFADRIVEDRGLALAIINTCDAALAKPPRNCDVGTAEEQLKRFKDFCRIFSKDETCDGCPLLPQCSTLEHCTLKWAQMPYKKGGE